MSTLTFTNKLIIIATDKQIINYYMNKLNFQYQYTKNKSDTKLIN